MNDNLVPEPQSTVLDSVEKAVGDKETARRVMLNPSLAKNLNTSSENIANSQTVVNSGKDDNAEAESTAVQSADENNDHHSSEIPLKAVDDIGRATAADVREALHQVIDPELGIDVIDLGLVYGIEIDELGRAIITMTLTTPACPLTDLIEDECASMLAGLVEEFRIDWTWQPRWTIDKITPEGREQLAALGFNFDSLPSY